MCIGILKYPFFRFGKGNKRPASMIRWEDKAMFWYIVKIGKIRTRTALIYRNDFRPRFNNPSFFTEEKVRIA